MVNTIRRSKRAATGFTLIELLVVVLIIGILAAIAAPQYFKVVEKGRFAEATACFSVIKGAQERYFLKNNTYVATTAGLDTTCGAGKAFAAPTLVGGATFTASMVRNAAPAPYGSYTTTFTGPSGVMTCSQTNCITDLLP